MTNEEIISKVAVDNGINTELHTIKMWNTIGKENGLNYRVRKGEHGIECKLWKKRKNKEKDSFEFYLAKAYLFAETQIEIVRDKTA